MRLNKYKHLAFPVLTIIFGIVLLIYMITVEDEPGALPLLLVLIGVIWMFIRKRNFKTHSGNKNVNEK